ncbi:MAG: UDP-N-acetylglucosamine 4,6-dehydratase (inverting) [Patescibacteria group bacterium]
MSAISTKFLKNKTILITGGTGSFGRGFVKYLLHNAEPRKVIVFSRDELKQSRMSAEFNDERLNFFLGDIRDLSRLQRAFRTVDIVIHAAALKQVPTLEYNPFEAIRTNILGSQNVIDAAIDQGVERVVLISTDKAAQPVNLYGATKLCAEKLFINGNFFADRTKDRVTVLSAVRYGNVIGSRGSVVDVLKNKDASKIKKVEVTHPDMTRFWISLEQSFALVMFALTHMSGGEIFVPKIRSMKVLDLLDALTPGIEKEIVGIRPGEKLHEMLLTEDESRHAMELDNHYVILSEFTDFKKGLYKKYEKMGKKTKHGFCFASHTNDQWLTKKELLKIIAESKFV